MLAAEHACLKCFLYMTGFPPPNALTSLHLLLAACQPHSTLLHADVPADFADPGA